jgi:polyisoprenoid-binding protein YceI
VDEQPWAFDVVHSHIGYRIRQLGVSWFRGRFSRFEGSLAFVEDDWAASSVEVVVDTSSIDVVGERFLNRVREPDFFDAEEHPQATFRSTLIEPAGEGRARLTGDLTLRGITRPIVMDAAWQGRVAVPLTQRESLCWAITCAFRRSDFGMTWNTPIEGGHYLGDEVELDMTIQAVRPLPQ